MTMPAEIILMEASWYGLINSIPSFMMMKELPQVRQRMMNRIHFTLNYFWTAKVVKFAYPSSFFCINFLYLSPYLLQLNRFEHCFLPDQIASV